MTKSKNEDLDSISNILTNKLISHGINISKDLEKEKVDALTDSGNKGEPDPVPEPDPKPEPSPPDNNLPKAKSNKLKIKNASLDVPFCEIHPGLMLKQAEILKDKPAIYPFVRSSIKAFNIPISSWDYMTENIFQDEIPHRLVVGLVKTAAYIGDSQLNPFNFDHFFFNRA